MLLQATSSPAGRDPEEWDDFPRVTAISFSKTSVGLSTFQGEHYLVDRATSRLEEIHKEQFEQSFAGSIGVKAAEVKEETGIESTVLLRTSSGKELTTRNAYCAEGEESEHTLRLDGAPLKDHVDPCSSVSCAEIVGDNLWLGTRHDGEYGDYPAQGIVVQTVARSLLVKTLTTAQGLSGDLIRAIRLDPFDKSVWIATNEGINVVDQDFRVLRTHFFYQQLDPVSGSPVVGLSPTKRESSRMAALFKELHTSDAKEFYAVAISIPAAVRERFTNEMFDDQYRYGNRYSVEDAFAPREMNVLVPFFIEDARSPDEKVQRAALYNICLFNDQRVIDFLVEQRNLYGTPSQSFNAGIARECVDKFTRFGLVSAQQKNDQIASMLKQEQDSLERIRAATSTDTHDDNQAVVTLARDLKNAGDRRGMDLINAYFKAVVGDRDTSPSQQELYQIFRDVNLYRQIGTYMSSESDIAPAMLEGLRKLRLPTASRTGCSYFDMRWPADRMPRRFDAKYAEAMLIAIERRGPQGAAPPGAEDVCAEAFKSQLGDSGVHQVFFKEVYPQLTPGQKELADKLSKEPPVPLPED